MEKQPEPDNNSPQSKYPKHLVVKLSKHAQTGSVRVNNVGWMVFS